MKQEAYFVALVIEGEDTFGPHYSYRGEGNGFFAYVLKGDQIGSAEQAAQRVYEWACDLGLGSRIDRTRVSVGLITDVETVRLP